MSGSQWFVVVSACVFAVATLRMGLQAAGTGRCPDMALTKGKPAHAVLYSLTGAMLPWNKESARLHLPVYALGVTYHVGTFLSFLWLILLFAHVDLPSAARSASAVVLVLAGIAGLALLLRRIASSKLRYFSSPDDYFSNALVIGFQVITAVTIIGGTVTPGLLIYGGLLLMYIPVGKLRHAIYFTFARFHLGVFYGRRGVWCNKGDRAWRS